MAGLLTSTNIGDLGFLRQNISRDTDMESSMVRAGLLRKIIDDAEKLHKLEEMLPRFIDATAIREIMHELEI